MASRAPDPRTHITPEAFGVAPELLGLPLATPARRAAAMVCDVIPLGILIGAHVLILAIAAAAMLWRASTPTAKTGPVRRGVRALLRVGTAALCFIIVLRVGGALFGGDDDEDDDGGDVAVSADVGLPAGLAFELADLGALPDVIRLVGAEDTDDVRRYAGAMATWLAQKELTDAQRQEAARDLIRSVEDADLRPAAESAFAAVLGPLPHSPAGDSAILAYAAALERSDTTAVELLRDDASAAIAGERIASLSERVDELEEERAEMQRDLARAEDRRTLTRFIRSLGDDLGIGFGWGAVYFTSFLALWSGYTPGKWLLGIRVIRLDGKPLGWWRAFERFGGYAASLSTGLLGFLQILWDRNRQGLHDKAAETVVIRTRAQAGQQTAAAPPRAAR
jgi:RDD family